MHEAGGESEDIGSLCSPEAAQEVSEEGIITCGEILGRFIGEKSCGFLLPNGHCLIQVRSADRKRGY